MTDHTNIEWCDATVNWWVGCTQISPACDHCYAKRIAAPFWGQKWGPGVPLQRFEGALETLKALDRKAQRLGRPLVVFHNSVSDMFDKDAPDEWRMDAFQGMADTPNLIHLVLTKRIGNVRPYTQRDGLAFDLIGDGRVRLGITVCNQEEADRDIPKLLAVPAAQRFLSLEPLLGPVDLRDPPNDIGEPRYSYLDQELRDQGNGIDWVIVGGESGPGARPMHPDWARSLRDQCQAAGVPFLFKQWGEWLPGQNEFHEQASSKSAAHHQDGRWGPTDTKVNDRNYVTWNPSGDMRMGSLIDALIDYRVHAWAERVGKKASGRLLDGVEHNGRPA
jgi:protein gp37